ncbi:MAG: carbon monoxide dehydrogenase subunit G [Candidatus Latescibacteria bacterium]|nr:carbon monoxide dehydrogenase subunit G [Candidatus Latescibacterota bacterium]
MRLSGTHTIGAPPEHTFELLIDPEVLMRCIHGCKDITHKDGGVYDMTISAGIGPIRGTYTGTVSLSDLQPPTSYTMAADIKGPTGFVNGLGTISLESEDDTSSVTFDGDVQIGGPLAAIGQRLHLSGARLMIRQLFGAMDAEAQAQEGEEVKHTILGDILRTIKK